MNSQFKEKIDRLIINSRLENQINIGNLTKQKGSILSKRVEDLLVMSLPPKAKNIKRREILFNSLL